MARKKKGGSGEAIFIGLAFVVFLIALIPKEIWIGLGCAAALATVIYFWSKATSGGSEKQTPILSPLQDPDYFHADSRQAAVDNTSSTVGKFREPPAHNVTLRSSLPGYQAPQATSLKDAARWIPPNETVSIYGCSIPGGMLYIGTHLGATSGGCDPCLINPNFPLAARADYSVLVMNYWLGYESIPPQARRSYVDWLAGGRLDPNIDIGCVFLFFYGLERRVIVDSPNDTVAATEHPLIAQELHRLLGIYGSKSGSFKSYASNLLGWLEIADAPDKLYLKPVPAIAKSLELPAYLRLALGQTALDRVPVPAELAVAWVKAEPAITLPKAAVRCEAEFNQLFSKAYAEQLGPGLQLPLNRSKLKFTYKAVSPGFADTPITLSFGNTPDVTALTAPVQKLAALVEKASVELDAYSRYLGRNPGIQPHFEKLLFLPPQLWPSEANDALAALKAKMGTGMIALNFQDLLSLLGAKIVMTRDTTLALGRALASTGIGMEPDVHGGARTPKGENNIVIFSVPAGETSAASSPAYQAALLTLELAAAIAAADGDFNVKEISHLRQQIQSWSHLNEAQSRRLMAHLRLLILEPISVASLKKKIADLDEATRETLAVFMATVAQVDGQVSSKEVRMLESVYKALGMDIKRIFSDVHAVVVHAESLSAASAPVPALAQAPQSIYPRSPFEPIMNRLMPTCIDLLLAPLESPAAPDHPPVPTTANQSPVSIAVMPSTNPAVEFSIPAGPAVDFVPLQTAEASTGLVTNAFAQDQLPTQVASAISFGQTIATAESDAPLAVSPLSHANPANATPKLANTVASVSSPHVHKDTGFQIPPKVGFILDAVRIAQLKANEDRITALLTNIFPEEEELPLPTAKIAEPMAVILSAEPLTEEKLKVALKVGFKLDAKRIAQLHADDKRVTALLSNIFQEEAVPPTPAVIAEEEIKATTTRLLGLDESHSAFARMLLSRPQWSRDQLMDIAADLNLMLDGALEQINEASYDAHDVPFTEGDEELEINMKLLEMIEL